MTPDELEARLEEAVDTLRRLPSSYIAGYGCSWPDPVQHAAAEWLTYANDIPRGRLAPPDADAIDRMDEVFGWLSILARSTMLGTWMVRLLWSRANGSSYQRIADMVSWTTRRKRSWSTIRRQYLEALDRLHRIVEMTDQERERFCAALAKTVTQRASSRRESGRFPWCNALVMTLR